MTQKRARGLGRLGGLLGGTLVTCGKKNKQNGDSVVRLRLCRRQYDGLPLVGAIDVDACRLITRHAAFGY